MRGISPEIKEAHPISQFLQEQVRHCAVYDSKKYPRQLHFLRQFCSCPENITGEGVMTGVTPVRIGVLTVL